MPGEPNVFVLSEKTKSAPAGFAYFGGGHKDGDCGISIRAVRSRNAGAVRCTMGTEGEEQQQQVQLVVAVAPLRPKLETVIVLAGGERRSVRNATFEVNDQVSIKCVSPNGRPAAELAWFLDDEPLTGENIGPLDTIPTPSKASGGGGNQSTLDLFTAVQTIVLHMRASDDNKTLTCRATHAGQSQEVHQRLKVGCKCENFQIRNCRQEIIVFLLYAI